MPSSRGAGGAGVSRRGSRFAEPGGAVVCRVFIRKRRKDKEKASIFGTASTVLWGQGLGTPTPCRQPLLHIEVRTLNGGMSGLAWGSYEKNRPCAAFPSGRIILHREGDIHVFWAWLTPWHAFEEILASENRGMARLEQPAVRPVTRNLRTVTPDVWEGACLPLRRCAWQRSKACEEDHVQARTHVQPRRLQQYSLLDAAGILLAV